VCLTFLIPGHVAFANIAAAHIYIQNSSSPTFEVTTYESVPIAWRANPLSFGNISGLLVLANQTDQFLRDYQANFPGQPRPALILADLYPGYRRPYVEDRIVQWARLYNPVAVVFLGGSPLFNLTFLPIFQTEIPSPHAEYEEGIFNELGSLDQIVLGIDTSESKYPIVQTYWSTWYALKPLLLNGTILNTTITDQSASKSRSPQENSICTHFSII
jgi:hypothetical protein